MLTRDSAAIRIDIVSDAICPWCYIGKRQLERALKMLGEDAGRFAVRWNPFQLNPEMPKAGADRAAYRAAKFGSAEQARALDARITAAARAVGLEFRTDLMRRTPNTLDAHRLMWLADTKGVQDAAMEAVFAAYFVEGRDIGDRGVLADCAARAAMDRAEAEAFLAGERIAAEMLAAERAAREAGVNGVPSFFLDGYFLLSGAVPAEQMAAALRRGRAILQQAA